jgi:hypothetical protein
MNPLPHITTLREIEQQEDAAQAEEIKKLRLEELRQFHDAELRRQGLGYLLEAKDGDCFAGALAVDDGAGGVFWILESE